MAMEAARNFHSIVADHKSLKRPAAFLSRRKRPRRGALEGAAPLGRPSAHARRAAGHLLLLIFRFTGDKFVYPRNNAAPRAAIGYLTGPDRQKGFHLFVRVFLIGAFTAVDVERDAIEMHLRAGDINVQRFDLQVDDRRSGQFLKFRESVLLGDGRRDAVERLAGYRRNLLTGLVGDRVIDRACDGVIRVGGGDGKGDLAAHVVNVIFTGAGFQLRDGDLRRGGESDWLGRHRPRGRSRRLLSLLPGLLRRLLRAVLRIGGYDAAEQENRGQSDAYKFGVHIRNFYLQKNLGFESMGCLMINLVLC